ncbi:E3 ubiquitin-protein ligase lubel isoform X5 [Eupeodes corollae]|uniref:E3 ubiquitin-protein ligase lubel isoform X5 n=1 Tax=Eupeodes corollae TaxID=290404 RepID=UPI002490B3F6|nr:E3 ubiquitin-protein ligase lubel isoform X5 [Eupeodes corollae]
MNNSSFRTNTLPTKLKVERSMPKWVTEANDRIGPKPPLPPPSTNGGGASSTFRPPALPPKKNQPEPDYEVIEFSGQQYSNEPTTIAMRPKTPDARRPESAMKCTLCGSNSPWVTCDECAQQIFCASCDDMFHKHPKRKTHLRKAIEVKKGTTPLIPPKALTPTAPVAPPRRNKKGMPSPMPLRRDQVIGSTATTPSVSPVPGSQQQQPAAWQDRLGSLRRGLNLGNRPLPETPRTPSDGVSSRSTTPNSKSVFDQIQKPPSITLEKIKTKASATLDRMALLQQRYRQHKQSKPNEKIANGQREQNLPSDQWSNISSPSQFRSGSMSSGINSFDYPDDTPFHFNQQMSMGGMRGQGSSARNMSTSVFNLNQMSQQRHHRDQQSPMWMGGGSQMQQAQSMAQLNCINCHSHGGWNQSHQHSEDWPGAANSNLNRSNMSLNVTHGFYPNPHNQHMMHAPPVFMNMPGMYPYPMGMPVTAMNPGMMGMPSSGRSRVQSRASSRVPSPTHSRKSMQVRSKKRNDFSENELTDDEDSENDDRRSLMSQRSGMANARRTRRLSSVSQALEQDEPRSLRTKAMSSRDRRGPSMPKSVQDDWTSSRRPSIATSNANSNFNSYRKVYSDSPISPDSEASEAPPTRALVQAKIQEKMKESSSKTKSKPLVLSDNEEPPQSPGPKSPFETEEVEYQNGQDLKQSEETTTPIANTIAEDSSSLGPPPSTPEHEWECEFCTFVNEPKTKICSICCKTPKQAPQKASQKQPTVTSASAKVSTSTTTTTTGVTNGIAKLKISQQTEDESEDYTSAAKKKEMEPIDDIWATLDENIQAEAKKAKRNAETAIEYKKAEKDQQNSTSSSTTVVAKESKNKVQKVSTGCGPSPPKEITRELRSTATSPVPQTMATQTYDTVVPKRIEENNLKTISTEMPTSDFQNQSFTPPTRNFSPKEMFMPMMPTEPTTSREAENMALMDRNMRLYRDGPAERYRSSTDIRSPDLSSAVQASRTQIPDYISLQKAQTYHNDIFFDPYATSKRNEPARDPEIELFMMLKEAEHYKFTAEELHAALKNCGDTHPIVWLRDNWSKLIQTVQSLATKYGQERIENVIGTISAIEAREALRLHGGNVWQAISECVEQRQRKYLEISAKGNYSREDIVTALTAHHGNMDLALLDLSKTQLKPFLMRVWGSPGGVENESVNFMQPQPLPPSVPKSVSDGELFGTGGLIDENDTSSPKQDIIGAATSSDPISENDFAIELTNVESDLIDSTIVNGLKLVQTEMEKVLQSESQSSEAMEDNKPSTSKAVQITKENKQVQHLKKTLQNKSQSQRNKSKIPSVTKNKLDNVIIDQKEETKSFQNAKGTDSSNDEASSNLENSSEYISEPLQINTIALVPNAKTKEEQSITEEITSLLETKFIESYNELSKSQSNQNYPVTQTEILEINEPSSSRTSSELNIQEPKLPSVSKSPEPNVSEYDGEIKESIQIYEINNTSSSSSDKIIQQHTENHEDLENTTQLAESNEPSLSSSTDKRVIHNINEQLLQDNLESNNQENNTEDSIVLIPNEASSSLVSALKGLLKNEEPTTSVTQVKDLISASSLTNQIFEAQPFLDSTDFQNGAKQISVTPSTRKQENENVPGTSKDSIPRKSPPKKTVSKIPKPKVNSKPAPTPTRSKSFSAPSPIGVSSVRAIQQELFNKQAQLAKPSVSGFQRPIPPKLVRKKSITDAISKFTQATSEHTVQRSRTQPKIPKIPKKKYHETCFSDDDYQDSSSEEEEPQPVEVRLRKQSAPVFRTYASIKELQLEQPEICAKRLIDEQLVSNMAEAQIAAALVGMRFQQDVSIWAAKECCDLEQAIALLQQECELCMGSYPLNQIVSMLKCTHKCCKECAKNYFTIQITDRSINDCNCPFCKTPELHDPNVLEDENLEYFSNLDIFIKNIVEPEVHELFQRKLRDRTLMQDPNFKWCIQCSSGFFARPKQKRLICPDCGSVTCSQCRKTWEKQHEGLTCEKFQEWKDANDPEVQAKGVAEHLALNGIDCPKCRFKYSLARGGCMHFTCTQCKFEFCYGCGRPFMMGAKCTVSPYCSKLGLHSHHPRSCLFYLRDKEPHTLQNLLLQNNVPFDVDPIVVEGAGGSKSSGGVSSKCPIPLQKETPKGLVDTVCNTDVQKDHAGLCRQHYVEYLANKVSKASIDPLPILDLTDCVQELRRRGLPLPERGPWDTDEIYRDMCSKVIKEKIPL